MAKNNENALRKKGNGKDIFKKPRRILEKVIEKIGNKQEKRTIYDK